MAKYTVVNRHSTFGIMQDFNDIRAAVRFAAAERSQIGGDVSIYLTEEEALRRGMPLAEHYLYLSGKALQAEIDDA